MPSVNESQQPSAFVVAERRTRFLTLMVLVGIVLYVLLDVLVQVLPPHYSALAQPESDLAVGPFGFLMAINFVIRGLVALVLVWALVTRLPKEALSQSGLSLVGIWGVGALLLAIFPTDVAGSHSTLHGTVHLVVALLAFICGAVGELLLTRRLVAHRGWRVSGQAAMIIAILALVLLFLTVVFIRSFVGGLIERVFLGLVLLWMVVVALRLRMSDAPAQELRK